MINKTNPITPTNKEKNKHEYRPNVALVVIKNGRVLLMERSRYNNNWQLPQGGIENNESPEKAMWRELKEETGIEKKHATIYVRTKEYIYYDIPARFRRNKDIKGQKQIWFLIGLNASDKVVHFNNMDLPEFQSWRWVAYWSCLNQVFYFKKDAYRQGLLELLPEALRHGI